MMMISVNAKSNKKARPGVALLVVLFIVMAITILSLGFVSRSDVELACGQNMILRTEMDYLAESGLEHARGLVLNPQDVGSEYWAGATAQQLVAGSGNYYDLVVVRDDTDPTDRCNYIIDCNSYRLQGADTIGRSSVRATLRLDPCIAYWVGSDTTVGDQITVNGDVYCDGNMSGNGYVGGDVFASGNITASNLTGQKNETVGEAPVGWPGLDVNDFSSSYYIDSTNYSVKVIEPNIYSDTNLDPGGNNPARVYYSSDPNNSVSLNGDVAINGTLVVGGDLTIRGTNNVITAEKNFPALLVTGEVIMEDGGSLVIQGLAQIGGPITDDPNTTNANISVTGGLFIANDGVTSDKVIFNITAAPTIAAIETWPAENTARRWRPVGGAFFRSIERIK